MGNLCFSYLDDVWDLHKPADRSTLLGALVHWKQFPGEPCALLVTWSLSSGSGKARAAFSGPTGGFPSPQERGCVDQWPSDAEFLVPGQWHGASCTQSMSWPFLAGLQVHFSRTFQGQAFQGDSFFPLQSSRLLLGSINHLLSLCFTLQL